MDAHARSRRRTTRLVRLALSCLLVAALAPQAHAEPVPSARTSRPNVFLLNIDMLRADHVGVYGYARNTTPTLDRIAREGVWFSAARAQAPWTYPSVVSLLTGLYPTSHGATYTGSDAQYVMTRLPAELPTLGTLLKAQGYTTAAFVTNPLLKRASGLDRGFEVFHDEFIEHWRRKSSGKWWGEGMNAADVDRAVLAWLDTKPEQPLFVYLHYIDVHGPYLEPKPFGRPDGSVSPRLAETARITGQPRDVIVDVYDGALLELDAEIGRFLDELGKRGVLDDSIVILTSDHGEEFGDHSGYGHGHSLYEELLHVPLIFAKTKAFPYSRKIDAPVAHVDVLPTLTDLLGVETPKDLPGRTLRPLLEGGTLEPKPILSEMDNRGRPVWNEKAGEPKVSYGLLVPPSTKYIVGANTPLGTKADPPPTLLREEVRDLSADPDEAAPSKLSATETAESRRVLDQILGEAHRTAIAPDTTPIDAETQERLRALGYIPEPTATADE